jgi:hypothetical protein
MVNFFSQRGGSVIGFAFAVRIHVVQRSVLASDPALPPACIAASGVMVILSSIKSHVSIF